MLRVGHVLCFKGNNSSLNNPRSSSWNGVLVISVRTGEKKVKKIVGYLMDIGKTEIQYISFYMKNINIL